MEPSSLTPSQHPSPSQSLRTVSLNPLLPRQCHVAAAAVVVAFAAAVAAAAVVSFCVRSAVVAGEIAYRALIAWEHCKNLSHPCPSLSSTNNFFGQIHVQIRDFIVETGKPPLLCAIRTSS